MDIQAYISSGILESYALGTATAAEITAIETNLVAYPELAQELAFIQEALENYALSHQKEAPARLKAKTMQAIFGEAKSAPTTNFTIENNKVTHTQKPLWSFNMAASWALLALSIAGNLFFWNKWQKTESKLQVAEAQNTQMAKNEAVFKANYSSKIEVMESDFFKKVILKGSEAAPNALASVYFNTQTNQVYLGNLKMPVLPKGKQYQLWAIVAGKPVNAGLINQADSLGKMLQTPNAQAFAISIENTGGSTTEAGPQGVVLVSGGV